VSTSWCHLPGRTTLQNSRIFKRSGLCATASSRLELFTRAFKAGFRFWDTSLLFPIPSAPFPPPSFRPSFSGFRRNIRRVKSAEAKRLRGVGAAACPFPSPALPTQCAVSCLFCSSGLRKSPKMVAQGARAGGRKRRSAGRCRAVPRPPPRSLLQLAGTRKTNSSMAVTGPEQPPQGKGSKAEAPPGLAAPMRSRELPGDRHCPPPFFSFSHLSGGEPEDTGAKLWVAAGQREGIPGGF